MTTNRSSNLSIIGVGKSYDQIKVLDDVSLELKPGEITCVIGGSGAGKSTLLRVIAGVERTDTGSLAIGEEVLSSPGVHVEPENRHIGLIFQDFALFPHLTVERNIAFGMARRDKAQTEQVVEQWLQQLSLTNRRRAYPHQLSGGEQQRVAIARALAPEPVAILMDEPFSGLDPALRHEVRDVALEAIRAATIPALLVTHDAEEALSEADTIAVLHQGRLLQSGKPDQLYRHPNNGIVAKALGRVSTIRPEATPHEWQHFVADDGLMFRPEAVIASDTSAVLATVRRAARVGATVRLKLELRNTLFEAHMKLGTVPEVGSTLGIDLDLDLVLKLAP